MKDVRRRGRRKLGGRKSRKNVSRGKLTRLEESREEYIGGKMKWKGTWRRERKMINDEARVKNMKNRQ